MGLYFFYLKLKLNSIDNLLLNFLFFELFLKCINNFITLYGNNLDRKKRSSPKNCVLYK